MARSRSIQSSVEDHFSPRFVCRRTFIAGLSGVATLSLASGLARSGRNRVDDVPRLAVRGPFPVKDLGERAALLSRLGFQGIELGPEYVALGVDGIRSGLKETGIQVSAIVGSLKLLDPDPNVRKEAVQLDRDRLRMGAELGASGVIEVPIFGPCRLGIEPAAACSEKEDQLLVEGLKELVSDTEKTGVTLLLEPLTRKETHFMNLQGHGGRIIEEVGGGKFGLLSDFYHMQMEEENVAGTLERWGQYTRYVHLADGEARTEPGSLPFDYRTGFRALKELGYSGWLTIESGATDSPEAALKRAREYIIGQWQEA
jgi:sugar phosphate isomerase/epimerase